MTTALRQFLEILDTPDRVPEASLVATLENEAPWFALPAAIRLQRCENLDEAERQQLAMRVALSIPGNESLINLIDRDSSTWINFYPADDTPARPDTADAITTFLETYGHGRNNEDDALLERLIFNPQPDYASVLEEEYSSKPTVPADDEHTAMIDRFLSREPSLPPDPEAVAPEPAKPVATQSKATDTQPSPAPHSSDSSLSESLAKIYIRQRRYDKAYEIISNLNLNFPEKSAYFADQLRFLQKLITLSRLTGAQ